MTTLPSGHGFATACRWLAVPELPGDPALYVRCLASGGYFEAVAFTADDRQRAEQYAKNAQRESLRTGARASTTTFARSR